MQVRPIPKDFAHEARKMTVSGAATHWRTCTRTIRRWTDEVGGDLREVMVANGRHGSSLGGRRCGKSHGRFNYGPAKLEEMTDEQRVMQFLQRKTRWVCYSSRIYGDTKDVCYYVGNRRLSFGELIALAKRYGFQG